MKNGKIVLVCALILAMLGGGIYVYLRQQDALEASAAEQAVLRQRVEETQEQLQSAEEEKLRLSDRLEALTKVEYRFDAHAMAEEIAEIGELAAVEYRYTNVGAMDSSVQFLNYTVPLTQKTVVVTMDGVIKVGVDVEKILISADEEKKVITLTIPEARLLSNELDEKSVQIYNESTGLFNRETFADGSAIREQIKASAVRNAEANGIYELARSRTEGILRAMLESVPGLKESYTIRFA
ncbi:MAG: DUF4230 domain-containing protein [Oscillospiraceae bacterium]|nr:DUF4230 domain-containing protein [Oscillospiraceae bacterium]